LIGLPYGPTGVALAFSIAMVLWLVPHLVWCLHGTPISVYELLSAAGRPLVAGAIAAMAVLILQPLLATIPLSLPRLAIGGTAMLAVYVFALLFVMKQSVSYFDVIRSLRGAS
jgi:PST family polysaccharide transporter